ncbi:silent information regulator protein Sir2 [Nitzschia inconspicua]|uniref:Silent information regulator protein Sir2 n=1 Tax=Nitzschia inconspicua TaxID=303405 RepID=A0A9K3KGZ8_9STRA|nr:silent information regulator protein Sir2 [Nitzschia inconspicua]
MGAMESSEELDDVADQVAEAFGVAKVTKSEKKGLELLSEWIENRQAKRIVVLTGAGVSTGAGIPDFRSPGTGLYDNLQKYNLPYPEAIFDVNFYRENPQPFVTLAKELWPGITFSPTLTHSFLKLLSEKGLLLRLYTQNIDGLEFLAGIPEDKLVECHGHFRTAACIDCKKAADANHVKETIVKEGKTPICQHCDGNVKPDIVFFGESLPDRFHRLVQQDIPKADLLLVMGTSLQVAPVSLIPDMVSCNRVLFNRDLVMRIRKRNDIFVAGDCDESVQTLCDLLGWGEALLEAHRKASLGKEKDQGENTANSETEAEVAVEETVETESNSGNQEKTGAEDEETLGEKEDNYTPSTILIMLGSMHFEHAGSADVLSLKISAPEERMGVLEEGRKRVAPNTVESLHLVLKSSSVSSLFEESLLSTFYDSLKPETGEVMVHVLPESAALADEMPVQADDVDAIRMGLVMSGYQLEMEKEEEGSWVLLAKKPGLSSIGEE